jgi:hypothetical protein
MNEFIMYLYGISTGIMMIGVLLYAKRQIEKAIFHGFAGSAPKTKDAIKTKLNKRTKDWQK